MRLRMGEPRDVRWFVRHGENIRDGRNSNSIAASGQGPIFALDVTPALDRALLLSDGELEPQKQEGGQRCQAFGYSELVKLCHKGRGCSAPRSDRFVSGLLRPTGLMNAELTFSRRQFVTTRRGRD